MSEYFEKLKDPRWQRKKAEIMQRDDFKCVWCGEAKKTLSVHHKYYDAGKEPWDYPDDTLETLCEKHHKVAESLRRDVRWAFTHLSKKNSFIAMGFLFGLIAAQRGKDLKPEFVKSFNKNCLKGYDLSKECGENNE